MKSIEEIFANGRDNGSIISDLKKKSVSVPDWNVVRKDYYVEEHEIVSDFVGRKDRTLENGAVEKAARISIGFEEMIANRLNQFTFSIPVKRTYIGVEDNETRKNIVKAIEAIYKNAHINSENDKRGLAYYASCEIFTVWYAVKKEHTLYGFPCKYKLRCKTYSPLEDDIQLYPLIDELGEMWAMSFAYTKQVDDQKIDYFETYTNNKHYLWRREESGWVIVVDGEEIVIGKIPGVYMYRKKPAFSHTPVLRKEVEYSVSRTSDTIAYNSAPILKVVGNMKGEEKKGESKRVWRVEQGGDVGYVSWNQSGDATKNQVETMLRLMFMQEQMPDTSFDNLKSLGNIGYDARMLTFADAHLRVRQESGPWKEFFERENNVIKAFLKKLNESWESEIDNVEIENVITPYIPNDMSSKVNIAVSANGGKPVMSQLEAIEFVGASNEPENTLQKINEEEEARSQASNARMTEIFG